MTTFSFRTPRRRHGDVLAHLGSNSVVQDMDRIRVALGAERVNFIGYSNGTRLAALATVARR